MSALPGEGAPLSVLVSFTSSRLANKVRGAVREKLDSALLIAGVKDVDLRHEMLRRAPRIVCLDESVELSAIVDLLPKMTIVLCREPTPLMAELTLRVGFGGIAAQAPPEAVAHVLELASRSVAAFAMPNGRVLSRTDLKEWPTRREPTTPDSTIEISGHIDEPICVAIAACIIKASDEITQHSPRGDSIAQDRFAKARAAFTGLCALQHAIGWLPGGPADVDITTHADALLEALDMALAHAQAELEDSERADRARADEGLPARRGEVITRAHELNELAIHVRGMVGRQRPTSRGNEA